MVADGLYAKVPRPDVCLGQHVSPLPAGMLGLRTGVAYAASDSLRVTLYGSGGHGSRPDATIDPVVMAASTVMRLQGIVSREIAATEMGVVTIGSLSAGTKANIIPDQAELLLSVRTVDSAESAQGHRTHRAPRGPSIGSNEGTDRRVHGIVTGSDQRCHRERADS